MNVMLVDSDQENIKNFRTYMRRSFPTMKVVGQFTDPNKDIIPAITDMKPALIVADIKFFGGVRFMRFRDIHDRFPNIKFIVYGTFNETEYMRRAREFGVIDYMFRPVKTVDLSRCLKLALGQQKTADDKKEKVKLQQEQSKGNISHYESIFLRSLAEGAMDDDREITDGFSHFGLSLSPGYTAAVIHIDHYRKIALTLMEGEKHLLIFKIYQALVDAMANREALVFITAFHSVAVLMGGYYPLEDSVNFFDEVKQTIYDKADVRISIGLGRTYDKISEISVSYKEAMAAFRYRNQMGYNSVIPLEFVEPYNRITYRYPIDREERLVYMAVVGDYEYCKQVLLELFDALGQSGKIPDGLLPKILMNIVIRISRYITEQNLPIANQVTRLFPTAEILSVKNLEEGLTVFDKALKNFCGYIRTHSEENSQRLYRMSKQYMDKNYMVHFSTAKMAVSLGTTPEHLNKVFVDRERISLFDYVMKVRMDHARWMLRESDLEDEEICTRVGFEEVKYFRSIFKQHEGRTTAEYRADEKIVQEPEES